MVQLLKNIKVFKGGVKTLAETFICTFWISSHLSLLNKYKRPLAARYDFNNRLREFEDHSACEEEVL